MNGFFIEVQSFFEWSYYQNLKQVNKHLYLLKSNLLFGGVDLS